MNHDIEFEILKDFILSNDLKDFKINQQIYGKFNQAGVHEEEGEVVTNFEIKERKVNFYDV